MKKSRILTLWTRVLKFFGLVRAVELEDAQSELNRVFIELYEAKNARLATLQDLADAKAQVKELREQAIRLQHDTMDSLKAENERVKEMVKAATEHIKAVEAQVSEIMQGDRDFKFAGKPAIPGATVMTTAPITAEGLVPIISRVVLTDEATAKIHELVSFEDKYNYAIEYLYGTSFLNRIARLIVQSGALQFTLGYNTDCSSVELYCKVMVDTPEYDERFQYTIDDKLSD